MKWPFLFASLIAVPLLFCCHFSRAEAQTLAVWSEFGTYASVEKSLPKLKEHNLSLYQAVHAKDLHDPTLWRLIEQAQKHSVPFHAWLLLDQKDGYWPSQWNAEAFDDLGKMFLHALRSRKLSLEGIIVDMESPKVFQIKLGRLIREGKLGEAIRLAQETIRRDGYDRAVRVYSELVRTYQQAGFHVHLVTQPLVIHDFEDGQDKIQRALGVPVRGIPWDKMSFMVYRPYFQLFNPFLSSDLVYHYGKKIRKFVGPKGAIDLGPVGSAGVISTPHHYRKPENLQEDLNAAWSAGIHSIGIFSLDGINELGGLDPWFSEPIQTVEPFPDVGVGLLAITVGLFRSFLHL